MFFFGIFSTATPLFLLLAFYLFGIVSMSFQQKKLAEEGNKLQAKEISFRETKKIADTKTYHFSNHFSQTAFSEATTTSTIKVYSLVEDIAPPDGDKRNPSDYLNLYFNKPPPTV